MSREEQIIETLLEWHKENRRRFPWRDETDPYKVLVAEFFLQRTPAERVAKVYPEFIKEYPTPRTLAQADPSTLMKKYCNLGLVKRMTWLVNSMKIVCDFYHDDIPKSKELLKSLPGIGDYTASAILCFAFGKNVEIVDANVIRLYSRLFNLPKKLIRNKSKKMIPKNKAKIYNETLLDFSAIICIKNPLCTLCDLQKFCEYANKMN